MSRLQFIHSDKVFENRTKAVEYVAKLTNSQLGVHLEESLLGEPFAVPYLDDNGNKQILLCIGNEGEKGEGILKPYHVIDSAKLEENIEDLSGSTEELRHLVEELQEELNTTQEGAGLNEDGTYSPNSESNYISGATSLKDADTKLDEELNRVETARKNVTGQHTDEYVPNQNLVTRPIAYISGATDMNDADVKLDEALQELSNNTIKHVVVDGVDSVDENNVATINISGDSIPIGEYENYEGKASRPHPIHNDYSLLDAVKQLDLNFVDFVEKEESERKGIHIVKVTTGLDTNVREAYDLVDKSNNIMENSERILIYKDSSLIEVYLGHTDDRLDDYTQPVVTPGTGDTALCFIYFKADGYYQLVCVNVEAFLEESEFLDGLSVDNHKVKVLIDTNSEEYLTVSRNGVKLSGIDSAINVARQDEEDRAKSVETALQEELDTTQTGAGLNENGTYKRHDTQGETNYIHEATSLDSADIVLDRELKRVEDKVEAETTRATAAEDSISGDVVTLARTTEEEFRATNEKIDNEISRATAAENTLQAELDRTQTGSGLNEDGTYKKHNTSPDDLANYINDATSLSNADFILDRTIYQLSAETETRFNNVEDSIISEVERSVEKDNNLQTELDATQTGAGLNTDGSYPHTHTANYIDDATSLNNADIILDRTIAELSAGTVSEFSNTNEKIDNFSGRVESTFEEVRGTINELSAGTKTELDGVKLQITNEVNRATTTEQSIINSVSETNDRLNELSSSTQTIEGNLNTLSGSVEELSAATETAIKATKVKSDDRTILVTPSEIGTNLSVNIDGITIAKDGNGVISTKLSIKKLATPSSTNVREEYALVDNNGNYLGDTVKVYKDMSLQSVELVTKDEKEYLRFTYILADGSTNVVDLDVSSFLSENEFKDGLKVEGSKVYVLIDPNSEEYLTVSSNGLKLSGINTAINNAVNTEKERATSAETALQEAIAAETTRATNKENELNTKIETETTRATNKENELNTKIETETTRATEAENLIRTSLNNLSQNVDSQVTRLDSKIEAETTRATDKETELNSKIQTEKERAIAKENELDTKIQTEELARQNADTTLDGKIAAETTRATGKETELQTAISNEVTRATNVESDLQTQITNEKSDRQAAITDVISQYTNAITEESTSRIDSDERLERMLTGYTSTTDQTISELTEKVNNEITRATAAENSISGNVNTLSGSVVTFSSSTVNELTTIKENIENLNAKTVVGSNAVNVNTVGNTSTVSLVINGSDNVLSQDVSGLKTTLSIDLSADGKTLSLKGKNGAVISTIDTTSFVKDGMLDNVTFDTTTKTLKFIFNTDSGKTQIDVPLGSLVDLYTVSANSTNYLVIDNYKVGAKVDVDGGLASKNSVDTLRNDTITSANTIINSINQLSGSVRDINTNLTNNISNLSASTRTIETNTNTNTTNISQLSASTRTIETNTNTNITNISNLSASTVNIKNDVNELSGSVISYTSTTENRYNLTVTSAQTLNTKIETETTRATNVENELRTLINNANAKTVVGSNAVNVNTVGSTSTVSLVINGADNVLSQDASGLKTTLTFDLSADGKTLSLKGKNGTVISTLDTSKFIKDGMLSNVEVVGTNLQFTFNTDSGKDVINVPLSSLADIYTVSGGSTSYLVIDNYKLAAKVDVDGGLASYRSLTDEVTARTNADVQINNRIDNLSAATVNIKSDVTNLSASTKNIETKLNELSGSTITIETNVNNNTNKINQLSSSTQTIENKVNTNTTNINQLSASTRIIENNLNTLSGSVVTFSSSTVTEINNIKNSISGLTAQTISGDKAITVTKSGSDSKVALTLNTSNKILSQDNSGLNAVISIATSSDTSNNEYIVLKGVNGETISAVNINSFVKDGMLQNVELIGTTLRFTFNTASGKNAIDVPLASLADTYTVSANSTNYLVIDNYKVGAKVDVDGGLASYGKLLALSGSVVTLSGTVVSNKNEINTLKEKVQTLETKVQTLEGKVTTLENTINNLDTIIEEKIGENIYNSIINILQGTTNEISVTGDSTTSKITISFANPYTVGQHDNASSTDY